MRITLLGICILSFLYGNTQGNNTDSTLTYSDHIRIDLGVSVFQGITRYFYPWYEQHFYLSVSGKNAERDFSPGISFTSNQSVFREDSLVYGKRMGYANLFLSGRLVKNNFPKNPKHNFYYGISIGLFYSYRGWQQYNLFNQADTYGIAVSPVLGFDQKIRGWLRFFCEVQVGGILNTTTLKQFSSGELYSDSGKKTTIGFFAYNPFILGVSVLLYRYRE